MAMPSSRTRPLQDHIGLLPKASFPISQTRPLIRARLRERSRHEERSTCRILKREVMQLSPRPDSAAEF